MRNFAVKPQGLVVNKRTTSETQDKKQKLFSKHNEKFKLFQGLKGI